jgi:hypothetical protein
VVKIKKFKIFESDDIDMELSKEDIYDIFIELVDLDFEYRLLNSFINKYKIELKKSINQPFDYKENDDSFIFPYMGINDLKSFNKEIDKTIDTLDQIKSRFERMGYTLLTQFGISVEDTYSIQIYCDLIKN